MLNRNICERASASLRCAILLLSLFLPFTLSAQADALDPPLTVTDLVGREVVILRPVKRIVLAEAGDILTLSLIHPNPAELVVGWAALGRFDTGTLEQYRRAYPAVDAISVVGGWTADTFSVEKAISLKPDLVLTTTYQAGGLGDSPFVQAFEKAGIPVVFLTPAPRTVSTSTDVAPLLTLLGKIFDREAEAKAYIAFYEKHLNHVRERIKDANPPRPKVLIETYAGLAECCRAPGWHGWAEFVEIGGGENLGKVSPSANGGMLSMEFIIAENPAVYIGNGGSYLEDKGLVIGPAYSAAQSRDALAQLMKRPGFSELDAVKTGRVHGIWTALAGQPLNILAIEAIAKWLHPALFADLEPQATLDEINSRFLSVPMTGVYWTTLLRPSSPQ